MRRRCHGIHVVSEAQATSPGALTGVGRFFAKRAPAHTFLIDGVFGVGTFVSSASGKHAAVEDRDSADVTQEMLRTGLAERTIVAEAAAEG